MTFETTRFDVQNFLKDPKSHSGYLEAVLEDGDPSLIAAAIGDIAKARGISEFAREAGLSREVIYKGFRPGGNPTLASISKAVKVLGLRLALVTAE